MPEPTAIFLFGAGGHGRAVSEAIRREGRYRIARVLDDDPLCSDLGGVPVHGGRDQLRAIRGEGIRAGIVSIGDNATRSQIMNDVAAAGLVFATVIDPSAVVASDAVIGAGTVLMPLSFAGAGSSIGDGVILNTAATVDHDCVIEDYAHLAVGSHLVGGCRVGSHTLVGIGAVLGHPVTIGRRATIGAGAAVMADVEDGVVAAGVPARPLRSAAGAPGRSSARTPDR